MGILNSSVWLNPSIMHGGGKSCQVTADLWQTRGVFKARKVQKGVCHGLVLNS